MRAWVPAGKVNWDIANCRGVSSEIFFGDRREGIPNETKQAKALCGSCEIKQDCLDWAIENEEPFGMWGGMTPTERKHYAVDREQGEPAA